MSVTTTSSTVGEKTWVGEYVIYQSNIPTKDGVKKYDVGKIVAMTDKTLQVRFEKGIVEFRCQSGNLPTALKFADTDTVSRSGSKCSGESTTCPPPPVDLRTEVPPVTSIRQPVWVEKKENGARISSPFGLQVGHYYDCGEGSLGIYKACCEQYDWDLRKQNCFGQRTIMYASKATPEGYSVWFLPHHRWIEKEREGRWFNVVGNDWIYEYWNHNVLTYDEKNNFKYDDSKRLTFAKNKYGKYVYIGIFEPVYRTQDSVQVKELRSLAWTKVYKKVGGNYTKKK